MILVLEILVVLFLEPFLIQPMIIQWLDWFRTDLMDVVPILKPIEVSIQTQPIS